jgi:putative acetyltransferase
MTSPAWSRYGSPLSGPRTLPGDEESEFFRPLVRDEVLGGGVELACVRDAGGRVAGFLGAAGGKIEMPFVDPPFHGRGIGRRLVGHAVGAWSSTAVDVNEQNKDAVGFYLRLGFEVVQPREASASTAVTPTACG